MKPASITYDKHANALDITLREDRSARQQPYTDDVILDFDGDGNLLSIEVLDLTADLASLVRDYSLNSHLLEVIAEMRALASEATKHVVVA
jgi:uncharacterized protein YuzE